MKALFLVSSVGLGHVARSYRISTYLKKKGFNIYWITSEPCISFLKLKDEKILDISYELKSLCDTAEILFRNYKFNFDITALRKEFETMKYNAKLLEDFDFEGYDVVFFDEFYEYFFIKRRIENAIYITDFVSIPIGYLFPLSLILNDYLKKFYKRFKYRFFAGLKDEIKNKDFIPLGYIPNIDKKIKVPKSDEYTVLITFGGSNVGKYVIKKIVRFLKNFRETMKIYIALGPRISREEISSINESIKFLDFTDKLYYYIAKSDLVITSGGYSTMSDILYLKKPAIVYPIKNHFEQINRIKFLEKVTNHVYFLKNFENIYEIINRIKRLKKIKGLENWCFEQYKRIYSYVIDLL